MSRQWNVHDLIYLIAWHTDVHIAWNEIEIFSSFMIFPVVFYISRKWRRMTSIFSFQSIITKQLLSSPRRWHTLPYDSLYCPILVSSSECGCGRMIVGFTTICNHYNCELESRPWRCVLDTRLSDNVCQWFAAVRCFSPSTPNSSNNKPERHDISEILLKVALSTIIIIRYYILTDITILEIGGKHKSRYLI
jgi:hypothetical protein